MIISLRSEVLREIWIATWLDGKTQDLGLVFAFIYTPLPRMAVWTGIASVL